MNLATGAMGSLLPKLVELLKEEYKLKKKVREGVESLSRELRSMHAALRKVGEVPRDQLDEQVKIWAGEVRELSFDMEDVVDKFLVRVDDGSEPAANPNKLKGLTTKMVGLFTKGRTRHDIANAIKDINKQVREVGARRARYNIDNIVTTPAVRTSIDPRIRALYTEGTELVGIAGKRDQELIKLLTEGDNMAKKKLKIVSVVGFGGLGKTTLVKTVYDKIKGDFDCGAFVPVGRNANVKKILVDILLDLDLYESQFTMLDIRQLINKLRESLETKRYLIIIDDIRDNKLWRDIKCAFSNNNNFGSRIITTTRIVSVAKLCCPSSTNSIYQMEPLSDDDSRKLFYKRIFSHKSGCPLEFEEVSIDILKKCGGVPLAIITIASLLTSDQQIKPMHEWHFLLDSIGHGLTEDPSVEEMFRILSFSYFDLPSHLKTCLLYLSMFPEDHMILKDQLIWMWVAESFVQCGKAKISLFEIGETYFNELLNRSLIQPVYDLLGFVYACRVHDSVLDLISSLSSEENFVTILNGTGDIMSSQSNVRRLSLQKSIREEHQSTHLKTMNILQVRSSASFESGIGLMPSFSSFVVLRVLDLSGCKIRDYNHLNLRELGSLIQLRYLSLARTGICEVPEEVGKLQFLQVLDLSGNDDIKELPSTVTKLRRLMCLLIDRYCEMLPDGMGNLTSMEALCEIHGDSVSNLKELGNMKRLRDLRIWFHNMSLELAEAFVESLGKLSNIQTVKISFGDDYVSTGLMGERWEPPPSLLEFTTNACVKLSILPVWIRRNPSHLPQLSKLDIFIQEVRHEDLACLGRLPALCCLVLRSSLRQSLLLVGADGFRCLISMRLHAYFTSQIVFQQGALPNTEQIELDIGLCVAKEEAASMENLCSLRKVHVTFDRRGVTVREAKQAKDALNNALRAHPNHPTFCIDMRQRIPPGASDDDVCY